MLFSVLITKMSFFHEWILNAEIHVWPNIKIKWWLSAQPKEDVYTIPSKVQEEKGEHVRAGR